MAERARGQPRDPSFPRQKLNGCYLFLFNRLSVRRRPAARRRRIRVSHGVSCALRHPCLWSWDFRLPLEGRGIGLRVKFILVGLRARDLLPARPERRGLLLLLHDAPGHLIGFDLVPVTGLADGHFPLHLVAILLHHVGKLVRQQLTPPGGARAVSRPVGRTMSRRS